MDAKLQFTHIFFWNACLHISHLLVCEIVKDFDPEHAIHQVRAEGATTPNPQGFSKIMLSIYVFSKNFKCTPKIFTFGPPLQKYLQIDPTNPKIKSIY